MRGDTSTNLSRVVYDVTYGRLYQDVTKHLVFKEYLARSVKDIVPRMVAGRAYDGRSNLYVKNKSIQPILSRRNVIYSYTTSHPILYYPIPFNLLCEIWFQGC